MMVATMVGMLVMAPTAQAWDCPPGVPDTQENQQAGICVEHKPRHKKKPTPMATPVPPTPVATPIPTPIPTPVPTLPPPVIVPIPPVPTPTTPPVVAPVVVVHGASTMGEVCHYEPTTGTWEIRNVPDGNARVEGGDEWPIAAGVCDQHVATPVPTVQPVVTAVPFVAPIVEPVAPIPAPEPMPEPKQSACFWIEGLWPIPDDNGNQLYADGLPVWLAPDGTVMTGELCPVVPAEPEQPYVPVQIP